MPHPKPITYKYCKTCENLEKKGSLPPIIKAKERSDLSKAKNNPFHNWYYFTLGYSPKFVDYIIKKNKIRQNEIVLDPFVGAGTTTVECKLQNISSIGIDASEFMVFASKVKTKWSLETERLDQIRKTMFKEISPKEGNVSIP